MHNSAVVSSWSIDSFDCLTQKLFKKMSIEQISRAETFISAFVLFDELFLTEKYKKNNVVSSLNSLTDGAIKFVPGDQLIHSDDMSNHISFDADLHMFSFEQLAKEDKLWFLQHNPDIAYSLLFSSSKIPQVEASLNTKFFTNLRLWQWSLTNEMSELTNSVTMLPISLSEVSELAIRKNTATDMVLNRYMEYANYHNQKFVKVSEFISEPFFSELKCVPPFFTIFLDRCKGCDDAVSSLFEIRKDYSEFRVLRKKFTNLIASAKSVSEKSEIVKEWDMSWQVLALGEFKEASFLKRQLTSADVSSSVFSPIDGFLKTGLTHLLDHKKQTRAYELFSIFGRVEQEIGEISPEKGLLRSKFGVEEIIHLKKINR